jgi:hypothetical protein
VGPADAELHPGIGYPARRYLAAAPPARPLDRVLSEAPFAPEGAVGEQR